MSDAGIIERRSGLSAAEISNEYVRKLKPVILTDALKEWGAMEQLTPEFLKSHFGEKEVFLQDKRYRLGELVQMLEDSDPANPAPYPVLMLIEEEFPEIAHLFDPIPLKQSYPNRVNDPRFRTSNYGSRTELFVGGPGGNFPYIHVDYYGLHAWLGLVYGHKEYTAFMPEDAPYLYVNENRWQSDIENPWDPDPGRYPLYAKATPIRFRLGPGETLVIPNGVWHTAQSLDFTLTAAFDQLNRYNMRRYIRDIVHLDDQQKTKVLLKAVYFTFMGLWANVRGK